MNLSLDHAHNNATGNGNGQPDKSRMSHVGYFLVGPGRSVLDRSSHVGFSAGRLLRQFCRRIPLAIYLASILLATGVLTGAILRAPPRLAAALGFLAAWAALLLLCTSQLAVSLVHWLAMLLVRPRILPRMDFSKGIPPRHRTIVAIPTIIADSREIDDLLEALEVRFLANRDENLSFALLTDFPDAATEKQPQDQALLLQVRDGIEALNAKFLTVPGQRLPEKFASQPARPGISRNAASSSCSTEHDAGMTRRTSGWGGSESAANLRNSIKRYGGVWTGSTRWSALLRAWKAPATSSRSTAIHNSRAYSARQLTGTMAHPLNRPHYDDRRGRVTEGYGILQPRVGISMPSANRSRFARLFAGEPGIDPYTHAVSDIYQDVFEEGSFVGKGIYDLAVFEQAIGGVLPENRVLSHDLLEGAYARSGLVSDVLLIEEFPSSYPADVSRRYRWIRGDWQIAPWLLAACAWSPWLPTTKSDLGAIAMETSGQSARSLMPGALLALLIAGWLLPGSSLFFTFIVISILLLPALINGLTDLTRKSGDQGRIPHARVVASSITRAGIATGLHTGLFALRTRS